IAAGSIRSILVDHADSNIVFAASDVGLFQSADAGATFTAVYLPVTDEYDWSADVGFPFNFDLHAAWDLVCVGGYTYMVSGVYAGGASVDERSTVPLSSARDAGATWNKLGTPLSTNLSKPTVSYDDGGQTAIDCGSLDMGQGQSWYNLAIGVDPKNADRAIVG